MNSTRMSIANLTKFDVSDEQAADGAFDLEETDAKVVRELITFRYSEEGVPDIHDLEERAKGIAGIAAKYGADAAMINGPNFFQPWLEEGLTEAGIVPVHSVTAKGGKGRRSRYLHGAFIIGHTYVREYGLADARFESLLQDDICPQDIDEKRAAECNTEKHDGDTPFPEGEGMNILENVA